MKMSVGTKSGFGLCLPMTALELCPFIFYNCPFNQFLYTLGSGYTSTSLGQHSHKQPCTLMLTLRVTLGSLQNQTYMFFDGRRKLNHPVEHVNSTLKELAEIEAYPSCHWARGRLQAGQVASPSQGHTEPDETHNHPRSHSLLGRI